MCIKGGTTPSTKNPKFWNGNIYWTSPRDLSNHHSVFLISTDKKITEEGLKEIGSGLLPIGTILLSSRTPIGYLAISEIPIAINQGYIAVIPDERLPIFYNYLWIKKNIDLITGAANGSVFPEISKSNFRELAISIPPKESIFHFNHTVVPFFEKIKQNVYQIHTLTQLRDTLLPKLMSGEVRVR